MLFEIHSIGDNDYQNMKLLVLIGVDYKKAEGQSSSAMENLTNELIGLRSAHKVDGLKVYDFSDKVSMALRLK